MAVRSSNAGMWNVAYTLLGAFFIVVLMQAFGILAFGVAVANILYILATVLLVLAVTHWAGLV